MRIVTYKCITSLLFVVNLVVMYLLAKVLSRLTLTGNIDPNSATKSAAVKGVTSTQNMIENKITVVIRTFEFFDHDLPETVESLISLFPNIQIIIISEFLPYPPIQLNPLGRVKMINKQIRLTDSFVERDPLFFIHTKYILFIPDSTRIYSSKVLENMILELKKQPFHMISVAFSSAKFVECLNINLNIREWVIQYSMFDGDLCDAVKGKHAILVETQTVKKLAEPFIDPFPEAFYIQTTAKNIKVKLIHDPDLRDGKSLYQDDLVKLKLQQIEMNRRLKTFPQLGLKKVVRETGLTEWYGCSRVTLRCFPSVKETMPDYLWEGKWTPPCCLAGLRITARHVFEILDEAGVRYWLEGGSLLGAMRSADILPWDYDVDIGIYRADIMRCPWLMRARIQPVVDNEGYVWEKATEGDFYRVLYSQTNRLHVDLFPFYPRNGTMTKDTWFKTHKQDREFPEYYLHPMSSIEFIGRQVPAPNNIRDFLEFKFGKGAIENPEYPNPLKMKFSPEETHLNSRISLED